MVYVGFIGAIAFIVLYVRAQILKERVHFGDLRGGGWTIDKAYRIGDSILSLDRSNRRVSLTKCSGSLISSIKECRFTLEDRGFKNNEFRFSLDDVISVSISTLISSRNEFLSITINTKAKPCAHAGISTCSGCYRTLGTIAHKASLPWLTKLFEEEFGQIIEFSTTHIPF